MLQLINIRENKEDVLKRLAIKNFKDAETIINSVLEKDAQRRSIQGEGDAIKAEANQIAKQIGELMKTGKKDEAEKVNMADSLIFQTDKQLKEYGDKLPADKKEAIENAVAELKKAHEAKDLAAIDPAMEVLNAAWQAASQDLYNATQQAQNNGEAGEQPNADAGNQANNVQDVEFEEVK